MTKQEFMKEEQSVFFTSPHTNDEWEVYYERAKNEALRLYDLEAGLEQAIIKKYGEKELRELVVEAMDITKKSKLPKKPILTKEQIQRMQNSPILAGLRENPEEFKKIMDGIEKDSILEME